MVAKSELRFSDESIFDDELIASDNDMNSFLGEDYDALRNMTASVESPRTNGTAALDWSDVILKIRPNGNYMYDNIFISKNEILNNEY